VAHVLLDGERESRVAPFLSGIAPSPDGRILALRVCTDSSPAVET
jgi:hypothetical protein